MCDLQNRSFGVYHIRTFINTHKPSPLALHVYREVIYGSSFFLLVKV